MLSRLKRCDRMATSAPQKAGAILKGLGRDEGLAQMSALRAGLEQRKAAMYEAGFSPKEVQAWASGYATGLHDQLDTWLASLEG